MSDQRALHDLNRAPHYIRTMIRINFADGEAEYEREKVCALSGMIGDMIEAIGAESNPLEPLAISLVNDAVPITRKGFEYAIAASLTDLSSPTLRMRDTLCLHQANKSIREYLAIDTYAEAISRGNMRLLEWTQRQFPSDNLDHETAIAVRADCVESLKFFAARGGDAPGFVNIAIESNSRRTSSRRSD